MAPTAPDIPSLAYRADIDGLRAIAILTVVAYHVGVPGLTGGFVGVDVFFVISGYLITGLLFDESVRNGRIDLWAFYARRVLRLMPAFLLVLAGTLVLGSILLTPVGGEQQGLAKSALASLLLNANHYFLATTGHYFDGPAELQPLLHVWSLSVEEQFYLVWPISMSALVRMQDATSSRRRLVVTLSLVWSTSIFLSVWLTVTHPSVAFYVTPTRAWELATGALVALLPGARLHASAPIPGGALAGSGLLSIALAVVSFGPHTRFPGIAAALPALGAAAVILGDAISPAGVISRVLGSRPFVTIGLLSYSWYLWHWPLLAIARATTLGEKSLERDACLATVSLVLAWFGYRFAESPLRRSRHRFAARPARVLIVGGLGTLIVATAFAGLGLHAKYGPLKPDVALLVAASGDVNPRRSRCHIDTNGLVWDGRFPSEACWQGRSADNGVLVVWGDSHANQWVSLGERALAFDWGVLPRTMAGCPPLVEAQDVSALSPSCRNFNTKVLREMAELRRSRPVSLLISARWLAYAGVGNGRNVEDPFGPKALASSAIDAALEVRQGLNRMFAQMHQAGIRVVLILPPPEMPYRSPHCLARRSATACGVRRADYLSRRDTVVEAIASAARDYDNVHLLDPVDVFCDALDCPARREGIVQYLDDNHPSDAIVRRVAEKTTDDWLWLLHPLPPSDQ